MDLDPVAPPQNKGLVKRLVNLDIARPDSANCGLHINGGLCSLTPSDKLWLMTIDMLAVRGGTPDCVLRSTEYAVPILCHDSILGPRCLTPE